MGRVLAVEGVQFQDEALVPVWEKVLEGRRLSRDEGVIVLRTDDFAAAGRMADHAKRKVSGDRVYFVLG